MNCKECVYYGEDKTAGYSECSNEDISEELLEKHFTNDKPNCPHRKQRQ